MGQGYGHDDGELSLSGFGELSLAGVVVVSGEETPCCCPRKEQLIHYLTSKLYDGEILLFYDSRVALFAVMLRERRQLIVRSFNTNWHEPPFAPTQWDHALYH